MIGIFDSGLGGLTVLKEIKKKLPAYDYMYLGDTLHLPYGNRSDEAVFVLTKNACEYLFAQGCHLIIIACNTATAAALRRLQQEYLPAIRVEKGGEARNILGVVRPVAEEVARLSKGTVGVIGTRGTIAADVYVKELQAVKPELRVEQVATPMLVPLIEENWLRRPETKSIVRYYLRPLKLKKVDTLILGCTHYPLLLREIRGIMGTSCVVPNPAEIVANSLVDYLARHPEIETKLGRSRQRIYRVTDLNKNFVLLAKRFLGEDVSIDQVVV